MRCPFMVSQATDNSIKKIFQNFLFTFRWKSIDESLTILGLSASLSNTIFGQIVQKRVPFDEKVF